MEKIASNTHSSLLGQFVSYEENKVLWIQPLATSTNYIIFRLKNQR